MDANADRAKLYGAALESLGWQVRACGQCIAIATLKPGVDILSPDAMCNEHATARDAINQEFGPEAPRTQTGRSVYTPPAQGGGDGATGGGDATGGGRP